MVAGRDKHNARNKYCIWKNFHISCCMKRKAVTHLDRHHAFLSPFLRLAQKSHLIVHEGPISTFLPLSLFFSLVHSFIFKHLPNCQPKERPAKGKKKKSTKNIEGYINSYIQNWKRSKGKRTKNRGLDEWGQQEAVISDENRTRASLVEYLVSWQQDCITCTRALLEETTT